MNALGKEATDDTLDTETGHLINPYKSPSPIWSFDWLLPISLCIAKTTQLWCRHDCICIRIPVSSLWALKCLTCMTTLLVCIQVTLSWQAAKIIMATDIWRDSTASLEITSLCKMEILWYLSTSPSILQKLACSGVTLGVQSSIPSPPDSNKENPTKKPMLSKLSSLLDCTMHDLLHSTSMRTW